MAHKLDPSMLIADLVAAGGTVTYDTLTPRQRRRHRQLIYAAVTGGHVPEGKRLTYTGRDRGPMTISLTDPPPEIAKRARPVVAVPSKVAKYHPALTATLSALKSAPRDDRGRCQLRGAGVVSMNVSRAEERRALRLMNALFVAAEEHGYTVGSAWQTKPGSGYGRAEPVGILLGKAGDSWELRIVEKTLAVQHEPTKKELDDQRRWSWPRIPVNDYVPNGQLEVRIEGYDTGHRSRFADGTRATVDTKLGAVIAALDDRVLERQQRLDRERLLDHQYEQARIPAVEQARHRYVKDLLRERLARDLDSFVAASRMREFADAVEAEHPGNTEWVAFIRGEAQACDPVKDSRSMPTVEPPTGLALEPYLRGWPEHRPWRWSPTEGF